MRVNNNEDPANMFIEIIPALKTNIETECFSYSVPEKLKHSICLGSVVNIPFGNKTERGVVTKIIKRVRLNNKNFVIKDIHSVEGYQLPEKYISIINWIASYYLCSKGEALSLFLPPSHNKIIKKQNVIGHKKTLIKTNKLNTEQYKIFHHLKTDLHKNIKKPVLIHGVTGSGKTEIYIHLAKEALKHNKQVIVLVPEIILTPQIVERFSEIFGDQICLLHSKISKSKKILCYREFYCRKKMIIIGPRSALLVPSENIGLIIVDEEQEESYKQNKNPRYNAVDLAKKIGSSYNALVVLGSATPRIETYFKAKNQGYKLYELKNRHNQLLLPPAEIVDLKEEIKKKNYSTISEQLRLAINKTLKSNKQVLLFINRRGTSTFVSCRECGYVEKCPNCDIPLTHHISSKDSTLRCHHCNYRRNVPLNCPSCGGVKIKYFGSGIEKIENEIKSLFPKSRISRADSATITGKSGYHKFYDDFKNHKFDIAIGTQMLAKGFDIPNVDLVGIVSADVGLFLPYFRAGEKSFCLLTQVSGRSGRRHNIGKTIIQTYWPNSIIVKSASVHNYTEFYDFEIKHRRELCYPPFCKIIRVISENRSYDKAKEEIEKTAFDLKRNGISFIGPGLCFFQRIRNKWRWHILIKIKSQKQDQIISKVFKNHQYLTWDVDPTDLL